jgi:murein DD-endopeptidase MepM/ murein hydrolase activator NlpD
MYKMRNRLLVLCTVFLLLAIPPIDTEKPKRVFLPINVQNRSDYNALLKRSLDGFGAYRKAGHKHSGLDIEGEYGEYVYAIGLGVVKAVYGEYPYRTVLIEHVFEDGEVIFSGYTHVEDMMVKENDFVNENTRIGRMFTRDEFVRSDFYKNHVHFEIRKTMERYKSISIKCYTDSDLKKYFYDPQVFLKQRL